MARTNRGPTIYDVANAAGVSPATVSRALAKPGRVSYATAEHVRRTADQLGYRARQMDVQPPERSTGLLAMIVADIANPVFTGMIRGAGRTAAEHDFSLALLETEESETIERRAVERMASRSDGLILSSSRLSDAVIRSLAKQLPVVVLNRTVGQVASVTSDNVWAIKKATEHLVELGHRSVYYLSGPEASWANGMRWRGLREAGLELDLHVRRLGPFLPTMRGGRAAAEAWLARPSTAVIAYNDLVAIGFMQALAEWDRLVPRDVSVVGFDNIVDASLVEPHLTTIAAPLVSVGTTGVSYLVSRSRDQIHEAEGPVLLPTKLILRESTGPAPR